MRTELPTRVSRPRPVYYLFRLSSQQATPVARFTDRADAIRSAWLSEELGWHAEVRAREERPRAAPGPWLRLYRTILPEGAETRGDRNV